MKFKKNKRQRERERGEILNGITHIIGSVFALLGGSILLGRAILEKDPWKISSFLIYGVALFALYTFSALYHSLKGPLKRIFRKLDHITIYLLIAGTYTPITLVSLRGSWGWPLFSAIWTMAIAGILIEFMIKKGERVLPVVIYLIMGWLIVVAIEPFLEVVPIPGAAMILIGGIFYTSGIYFYAFDRRHPYFHAIWHLFVISGSTLHYFAIFFFVI